MGGKKKDYNKRLDVIFKNVEMQQVETVQELTSRALKEKSRPQLRLNKL